MILEKLTAFVADLPENKNPEVKFRMSSAGDCVRLLDYRHQFGAKPITAASYFRMELGQAVHDYFQPLLKKCFGDDFHGVEEEVELDIGLFKVPGHPDGRITSQRATVELKSVSDNTFRMISSQNKPLDAHIDQSNGYCFALGDENIIIVYINRDTGAMCEFKFPRSQELLDALKQKFNQVADNKIKGVLSPRPYKDATEAPCWFCERRDECYATFGTEVEKGQEVVVNDPFLISRVRSLIKYRQDRLVATKLEDQFKKELSHLMIEKKLRFATMADETGLMTAEVWIGKNNNPLVEAKEPKPKKEK